MLDPERLPEHAVLRDDALGMEPEPELAGIGDLFTHRVVMVVELDPRPDLEQLARVLAEDVANLANRELGQVAAPPRRLDRRLVIAGLLFLLEIDD